MCFSEIDKFQFLGFEFVSWVEVTNTRCILKYTKSYGERLFGLAIFIFQVMGNFIFFL